MKLVGYSCHEMFPEAAREALSNAASCISIARQRAESAAAESGQPVEIWDLGLHRGYTIVRAGSSFAERLGGKLEDTVYPPA